MTIQKHLGVSDHYSGLYYLRTDDFGETWTGPTEIPELASRPGENNETIAACDVTPGWLTHSEKLLAIGIKLRYGPKGEQLVDQPRSHECDYATYDPNSDKWTTWKMLAMPETEGKFFLVTPGCVQWLEQADGTLLIPVYFQGPNGGVYRNPSRRCLSGRLAFVEFQVPSCYFGSDGSTIGGIDMIHFRIKSTAGASI